MFTIRHHRRSAILGIGVLLLGAMGGWLGKAPAQLPNDPVEELAQALKIPIIDPMQNPGELRSRQTLVTQLTSRLHTIGELRRALALEEWLDKDQDIVLPQARLDQKIRGEVAGRYISAIRASLQSNQPVREIATADLLGDLGITLRGSPVQGDQYQGGLNRTFGPDLVRLLKSGNPRAEVSAARALGQINPDPKIAVPALAGALKSGDAAVRRAASASLGNMIKNMTPIYAGKAKGVAAVTITPEELVNTAVAVTPAAADGLQDADAETRRLSAEAILQAAAALSDLIGQPKNLRLPTDRPLSPDDRTELEALRRDLAQERVRIAPLAQALSAQAPRLARALRDSDAQTRLMARKALEEIGNAFQRQERREANLANVGGNGKSAPGSGEEQSSQNQAAPPAQSTAPLVKTLEEDLRPLIGGLHDPDLSIRLATVDTLEMFGTAARSAAPDLVQALRDPNLFVRWAAARTLGKLAPVAPELAVPGLANLLNDEDLDLRIQGVNALASYGPAAKAAVPALTQTVGRGDSEIRRAAMLALVSIGPDNARMAIPAIIQDLTDENPQTRQTAAQVLGRFGPAASAAEAALLQRAQNDSDLDVRRAASDALLDILPAPRER